MERTPSVIRTGTTTKDSLRQTYRFATMKLLTSLLALLPLVAPAFAAKRSITSDVYADYHKQAVSSGSLSLTDNSFDELTAMPRNHSVLVVLTALEARFGCKMCQDFKPEWDVLAKSWMNGDKAGDSKMLFGELDFDRGRGTFEKVRSKQTALYSRPLGDVQEGISSSN